MYYLWVILHTTMRTLLNYLKSLDKNQREAFADDVGTSLGYLNQVAYGRKSIGPEFALRLEAFSKQTLDAESLCPSFPWKYIYSRNRVSISD